MPPRSRRDVSSEHLVALEQGSVATTTLVEGLAMNLSRLVASVATHLGPAAPAAAAAAADELGYVGKMSAIGAAIGLHLGNGAAAERRTQTLTNHPSDTVRGWMCFAVQARASDSPTSRLSAIRAFAADPHFGVREWAWMATRPYLAERLSASLLALQPWAQRRDPNLRRFAIEVLRPNGVWCKSIPALRKEPEQALPLLSLVRHDASKYVQDSLANWLNDAARLRPDWVREVCTQWRNEHEDNPHSQRIIARALRRCGWSAKS